MGTYQTVIIVKSPSEIALMREAGQIANRVMTTAIERLKPGVRECDAVAAVYQAQMSGTPEFGGDYPAIVPMMCVFFSLSRKIATPCALPGMVLTITIDSLASTLIISMLISSRTA